MSERLAPLMPVRAVPSAGGGTFLMRPLADPEDFLFGLHGATTRAETTAAPFPVVSIPDYRASEHVLPPLLSIWHLTRCGSTLTARMLSKINSLQVTDEPGALADICGAFWALVPKVQRQVALKAAVQAIGQPLRPEATHLVIKQSLRNWRDLDALEQLYPAMHRVLLIRDPLEILVSNVRSPPGWLRLRHAIWSPLLSGIAFDKQRALSDAEFIARCLGRAFGGLADVVEQDPEAWLILDYQELPDAVPERLLSRLGIHPTAAERAAMAAQTQLQAWNRDGRRPFTPDSAAKQAAATAEMRALCDIWLRPAWSRLAALHAR